MFLILMLITCLLVPVKIAQESSGERLDLTHYKPPQEERTNPWVAGCVAGGTGGPGSPIYPMALALKLEGASYALGEEFTFHLILHNISGQPYTIPWDPDWTKHVKGLTNPPPGYLEAYVTLDLVDNSPVSSHLAAVGLYGSDFTPSSLKVLQPDDFVEIRALGRWTHAGLGMAKIKSGEAAVVRVQSRWIFLYRTTDCSFERTMYSNFVRVALRE